MLRVLGLGFRPGWFACLAPVVLAAACADSDVPIAQSPAPRPVTSSSKASVLPASPLLRGVDRASMDLSVSPGDAFYDYANGGWRKTATIPPDQPFAGGYADLLTKVEAETHALLEDASHGQMSASGLADSAELVGDFYASFMDEATLDKLGVQPLSDEFARFAAIKDKHALATELGSELRADVDALNRVNFETRDLFGLWAEQDLHDPSRVVPYLLQGGLGMPDRSYYLDGAADMLSIRVRYLQHLTTLLTLAAIPHPADVAKRVFELEAKIATAHATRADSGDLTKGSHPWKRGDFASKAPGIDWDRFFVAAQLSTQDDFVVWQPGAVTGIAALVASEPLATWKEWLVVRALDANAPILATPFADEHVAFHQMTLGGLTQPPARWKRAVARTNSVVADAVGRLYVARHFAPESKARIEEMVRQLLAAFSRRIDALPWMAPATKAKAKAKLATLTVGIAYPDHPRDYRGLDFLRDDLFGNVQRAAKWKYAYALAKLGKPQDHHEWEIAPQEADALNLPARNELNFPAAFLQAPAYRPDASDAMNYAAIGAIIGHEISHSFDNTGALFDENGKYENWWTADDLAHFQASSAALVAQYDAYSPLPGTRIDGRQTLGENIADLAGIAVAYDAYHQALHGQEAAVLDGFTGEQTFFIGFEQLWRAKMRDETLRAQLRTNEHAPFEYRGLTVRNLDAWYSTFDVKPTDALYLAPGARVRVW